MTQNSVSSLGEPATCEGADPAVVVRRTRTSDIDVHTAQLQDWTLHYDQLDCGSFEGSFIDIRWPGMQLFVETTTRRLRQRGHLLPDSFGIGTMLSGDGTLCINGIRAGVGTLLTCDSTELDLCTPPNCRVAGLVVDASTLHRAAESMPGLDSLLRPDMLLGMTPPEAALAPWRKLLLDVVRLALERPWQLHDPDVQQRLRSNLLIHLLDAMLGAQRADQVHCAGARKRIVDRACELMLSRLDEPLSLFEVCSRIGASPRKLGYCFQDVLGLSPARYIKAMRLNDVRRELARGDDPELSVYDAAARCGFWHFGHFSADYKKQFSELPSQTLGRARSGRGGSSSLRPGH
ncbi:MAG: helix-turn-helix domain-containing protein [Rubrivivax sp.]